MFTVNLKQNPCALYDTNGDCNSGKCIIEDGITKCLLVQIDL